MKAILVALGCAAALAGCAATPVVKSVSGEDVRLHVSNMSDSWLQQQIKAYDGKLSPDLFDFSGQFLVRYMGDLVVDGKIKEPGIGIASSLRNASMTLAASDLLLRSGTLGASGFFSKSFNATGLLLGAISPRSPEEQFVGQMNANYRTLVTGGVTFIRVDRFTAAPDATELERIFDTRFAEMRSAGRAPGMSCADQGESIVPGYKRQSFMVPLECRLDGGIFKYMRTSVVAAPGSFFHKVFGPSVVSRVTLTEVAPANVARVVELHQNLLGPEWVPIYPEFGASTVASKIVVGHGVAAKKYDPPAKPFSA